MTLYDAIEQIAVAIAFAEGFYVAESRAARNNNPGNLTIDTIGKSIGKDGIFVVYANVTDGWNALKRQVELILTNASQIYNNDMTIYEIAQRYTTTEQLAWANNVASKLGISINTKISDLLTVAATGVGVGVLIVFVALWWYLNKNK
ncbi:hypothetical protein L0244_38700 [bacterium]|nr:hypothetical protein [bacterium]